MPPSAQSYYDNRAENDHNDSTKEILHRVAAELEAMRSDETISLASFHPMPTGCLSLLRSLPGNLMCVDCGALNPLWASISYGCLLCIQCCGRHRSYGVNVSRVRSITIDNWLHSDVVAMLEGGNHQLSQFFDRHNLSPRHSKDVSNAFSFDREKSSNQLISSNENRYLTKAARFYRENMLKHVNKVVSSGIYKGRDATRNMKRRKCKSKTMCDSKLLTERPNLGESLVMGSSA